MAFHGKVVPQRITAVLAFECTSGYRSWTHVQVLHSISGFTTHPEYLAGSTIFGSVINMFLITTRQRKQSSLTLRASVSRLISRRQCMTRFLLLRSQSTVNGLQ